MANVFCYPGQLETTLFGSVVGTEKGEVGNADRIWTCMPQNLASESGITTAILLM